MRNTKKCPKCGSVNIILPRPTVAPTNSGVWLTIPVGALKSVFMRPYICCDCGFVEYWIENEKELKTLESKYKKQ